MQIIKKKSNKSRHGLIKIKSNSHNNVYKLKNSHIKKMELLEKIIIE